MADTEIWKHIPSEPGVMASSWGRVLQQPGYAPLPNSPTAKAREVRYAVE